MFGCRWRLHNGHIAPGSGLALKQLIDIGAGVIDEDYHGPIKVILINHGKDDFLVKVRDRIAQLVLECIVTPRLQWVFFATLEY